MKTLDFTHIASDKKAIRVHRWLPEQGPKAIILIAHGMAEHAARYARLAQALTAAGWAVYAPDHRGHGETAGPDELGWLAEKEGLQRVIDDLHEVADVARAEHPSLPLFLFGHSWGSVLSQAYIGIYGKDVAGCALSGVVEPPPSNLLAIASLLADVGCRFKGKKSKAFLLDSMSFGSSNKAFEPARTKFDWLSRDEAEVDKYVADPLCGFVCTQGYFRDFLSAFKLVYGEGGALSSVPANLPVLVMAGGDDPCGGAKGFPEVLVARLKKSGLSDVEKRIYPGARHEILNETNRAEVIGDFLSWHETKFAALAGTH